MIFIVVRIANLCDVNLIKGDGTMIRTAIIFFYIANEGLSIVQARILSPNHSGRRNQKITKIAIHHATGVINGRNIAGVFVPRSRRASAYYNLGSDGVIVLGVDESNRAWTTSSSWCDNRAVTIEVGNSTRGPQWLVSDYILNRLIDLVRTSAEEMESILAPTLEVRMVSFKNTNGIKTLTVQGHILAASFHILQVK